MTCLNSKSSLRCPENGRFNTSGKKWRGKMFKQLLRSALAAMLCSSCAVITGNGSGAHSKSGADDAMVAQAWSDFTLRTMTGAWYTRN